MGWELNGWFDADKKRPVFFPEFSKSRERCFHFFCARDDRAARYIKIREAERERCMDDGRGKAFQIADAMNLIPESFLKLSPLPGL